MLLMSEWKMAAGRLSALKASTTNKLAFAPFKQDRSGLAAPGSGIEDAFVIAELSACWTWTVGRKVETMGPTSEAVLLDRGLLRLARLLLLDSKTEEDVAEGKQSLGGARKIEHGLSSRSAHRWSSTSSRTASVA